MNWIEDIIENTAKLYNGREIVIWGAHHTSKSIKKKLEEEHNIKTAFFIDSNKNIVNEYTIKSTSSIKGKADKYFIVVPLGFIENIKNSLIEWGYEKNRDYYYFCDCIKVDDDYYYEDEHQNKIIGWHKNLKIMFCGFNSTVKIGDILNVNGDMSLYLHNNSIFEVGDNNYIGGKITFYDNTYFKAGNNNNMSFGGESVFEFKS